MRAGARVRLAARQSRVAGVEIISPPIMAYVSIAALRGSANAMPIAALARVVGMWAMTAPAVAMATSACKLEPLCAPSISWRSWRAQWRPNGVSAAVSAPARAMATPIIAG